MENNNNNMEMATCFFCGEEHPADDMHRIDGRWICADCIEDNTTICDCCGCVTLTENAFSYGYDIYCEDCFTDNFTHCDDCGELVPNEDTFETARGDIICRDCRHDNYCRCTSCGELYHNDDIYFDTPDDPYCEDCYRDLESDAIHGYSYKPEPQFYGDSPDEYPLYMGVELEIDRGGESGQNAREIMDCVNGYNEYVYCKHDGSIDNGFEIVSHPATLKHHSTAIRWHDLMTTALSLGYRSHNTDTCGLHVHVSKTALGDFVTREETIAKIVYFVEKHWDYLLKFSRRTEYSMNRWASRYGIEKDIATTYAKAKGDWNRYRAINLQNENTIEFRVFRGTLKHSTFIATLQLVQNICDYCKAVSLDAIEDSTWLDFVSGICDSYAELHSYLVVRGLK